jgi:acyl-CoA reductase-like NAD-dependent aldehyde dehydrogenase
MKKFTLLVNGKDLDTGNYRFFPYMDKLITNPKETFAAIDEFKKGKYSNKNKKFIYAKYCVNKKDTNHLAINAAYEASQEFKFFSISKRRKICLDITRLLKARKKELLELMVIEGHPPKLAEWELRGMEIGGESETLNFYSSLLFKKIGKRKKQDFLYVRRPDGVVCVCPPANAPASNSYISVFSLLSGNTLIIKPPLTNPLSTIYLWKEIVYEALENNKAPKGTVNVVLGNSQLIMEEWLSSPYVNDVIFFGDSKVGLEIGAKIYAAGKKPILELSGNDIQIVWKGAALDKAVSSSMNCFLGSTQICMVPKIILIHEKIYDKFVERIINKVKKLKVGLPSDPETILTPVTRIEDYFKFLEDALDKGAELLCGGKRVNYKGEEDQEGMYIQPTLLKIEDDNKITQMLCFKEEIFFPLLPLVKVSGKDEKIFNRICELVDMNQYGLRTSVWVSNKDYMQRFIERLSNSGLLRINLPHAEFSPFISTHGGTKRSGGPFGEMNYVWEKTSHLQGIGRSIL